MAGDIVKIRDLRKGNPSHKIIALGNGDSMIKVAVVLLSSDIMLDINEKVEERYQENPQKMNKTTRNQYYNMLLCFNCMRSTDDISIQLFDTEKEVGEFLNLEDIKRVCEAYNELIINNAPKLETMKEEDYDEVKKFLGETKLKDLSMVSLVHLMYFHQTIHSES